MGGVRNEWASGLYLCEMARTAFLSFPHILYERRRDISFDLFRVAALQFSRSDPLRARWVSDCLKGIINNLSPLFFCLLNLVIAEWDCSTATTKKQ